MRYYSKCKLNGKGTCHINAVIVICVSRLKSASFSSESEFSGRGAAEAETGQDKGHFLAEVQLRVPKKLIYFNFIIICH
jgi:hypothetical protein